MDTTYLVDYLDDLDSLDPNEVSSRICGTDLHIGNVKQSNSVINR